MAFSLFGRYRTFKTNAVTEFYLHISDLLEHEDVQALDHYIQHYCFSRLKHSLDVAYTSFCIAKFFGWDARSTARGGLLHDLFLYDWREGTQDGKNHAVNHPKIAAENAKRVTELNPVEEDIIRKHMWLVTLTPPRYKEGFIVTFVDKYCATKEFFQGVVSGRAVPVAVSSTPVKMPTA